METNSHYLFFVFVWFAKYMWHSTKNNSVFRSFTLKNDIFTKTIHKKQTTFVYISYICK